MEADVTIVIYWVEWSLTLRASSARCSTHPAVLTTGFLWHIIYTHIADISQSNDYVLAQSHFADTYALNPINMPWLHMVASDLKSDIGPANFNNI